MWFDVFGQIGGLVGGSTSKSGILRVQWWSLLLSWAQTPPNILEKIQFKLDKIVLLNETYHTTYINCRNSTVGCIQDGKKLLSNVINHTLTNLLKSFNIKRELLVRNSSLENKTLSWWPNREQRVERTWNRLSGLWPSSWYAIINLADHLHIKHLGSNLNLKTSGLYELVWNEDWKSIRNEAQSKNVVFVFIMTFKNWSSHRMI